MRGPTCFVRLTSPPIAYHFYGLDALQLKARRTWFPEAWLVARLADMTRALRAGLSRDVSNALEVQDLADQMVCA